MRATRSRFPVAFVERLIAVRTHPERMAEVGLGWAADGTNDFFCNRTRLAGSLGIGVSALRKDFVSHGIEAVRGERDRIPQSLVPRSQWTIMRHQALTYNCTEDDAGRMPYDGSRRARGPGIPRFLRARLFTLRSSR
jgi:hypothetical protein